MASKIDTPTKRTKLKVQNEPHFEPCGHQAYVGYRKALTPERCAWYGRVYTGSGYKTSKLLPGDVDFETARRSAAEFAELVRNGAVASRTDTVLAACNAYIAHVRDVERRPEAAESMARTIRRTVEGTPLAGAPLASLQAPMFAAWRIGMSQGISAGSVNRQQTTLRAALRWAVTRKLLRSDEAFALELQPIKNADGRRDLYLTREQRQAVLAALEGTNPSLGRLCKLLTLLPLRPGAAAALTVADLKGSQLHVTRDKTLGRNETRVIALPPSALQFLTEQAKGKLPTAPLLPNADGGHWESKRWGDVFRAACVSAGLPAEAVMYSLRHALLTDLANGGAPIAAVARMAGTSVAQLESNYYQGADTAALAAIERAL